MFSNLQAEMYWFYANLDIFFPIQYRDTVFSYILGNVKPLIKVFFLIKKCITLKHTLARAEEREGRGKEDCTVH